jgi:hypothetical protein
MSNENLAAQLEKIKVALVKWYKELQVYTKWALANDGVIDETEKEGITRRMGDINSILARVELMEKKNGISKESIVESEKKQEATKIPTHLVSEIEEIKRGLQEIQALMEQHQ